MRLKVKGPSLEGFCSGLFLAIVGLMSETSSGQDEVGRLRHASLAIRDQLPTIQESKQFYEAADKKAFLSQLIAEWIKSPQHLVRIERFFSDRFGTSPFLFLYEDSFSLERYQHGGQNLAAPPDLGSEDDGVYYLKNSIKSTCSKSNESAKVVSKTVWWSDVPVRMCQSAVSEQIVFLSGRSRCADAFGSEGLKSASCGCGKGSILCIPAPLKKKQQSAVYRELKDRALDVYVHGRSWTDYFAGAFYGNRLLMHYYFLTDKVLIKGDIPTDGDLAFFGEIPLEERVWKTFSSNFLAKRSGIVTAPSFMKRFNNFRSRIRALSENLLCQDIDASLNTSGISSLVNPSLSEFDKAHGTRGECASCHYALDNFGSAILGWDDQGNFFGFDRFWRWNPPSQKGHVFGRDGEGPLFLMDSLMTANSKFTQCMAKQAWEDFSGSSFDALDSGEKNRFFDAAQVSPKVLFETVFTSDVFLNLRAKGLASDDKVASKTYQFDVDIMPILAKSCAGSSCHSDGNGRPNSVYIGFEERFKKAPADRIANGSMPPPTSPYQLSPEEREILVRYLGQF